MTSNLSDADLRASYQAALPQRPADQRTGCPSPEALQALITQQGEETARLEVLDHVMSCTDCQRDFELLRSITVAGNSEGRTSGMISVGGRDRRRWILAAAAVVVAAATITEPRWGALINPGRDIVRSGPAGVAGVSLVGAIRMGSGDASRALVWHRVPGAQSYHAEVLDSSGAVVFQSQTADTLVMLPASTREARTWWVRATMADGTQRQSGIMSLGGSQ